jgi:PAS domain S-box-containing protein
MNYGRFEADRNAGDKMDAPMESTSKLKKAAGSLRNSKGLMENVIESAAVMIVIFDISGNVLLINRTAQRVTGYGSDEILGMNWFETVVPRRLYPYVWDEFERWQVGALHSDRYFTSPIVTKSGEERCISWRSNYIFDDCGAMHIASFGIDITDRRYAISERRAAEEKLKSSLQEKDLLLREIHHRVKNNLQVILSLLRIQSRNMPDHNPITVLRECQNRIRSMALIHDKLYRSDNLARVNMADYIRSLMQVLPGSFDSSGGIGIDLHMEDVYLGIDEAIPCGLIINELVTNCFKHAFPDSRAGRICICLLSAGRRVTLVIEDNGVGLPSSSEIRGKRSMGLVLVDTLVKQLKGSMDMETGPGSRFRICFDSKTQLS